MEDRTGTLPLPLSLAERVQEEMAAWDAVLKQAFRTPPYNPDDLLSSKGWDIYERMMNDAMVRAAINTKRYALLAKPWQVLPKVESGAKSPTAEAMAARDFVEESLREIRGANGATRDFRQVLFEMMSAFYRGFSITELVWRIETAGRWAGKYRLGSMKTKPPKQIGFEVDDYLNVQAITSWTPVAGTVRVPREKCVLYVHQAHDELPYGDSDLRPVYKHWWSKDLLSQFWNLTLEKFGAPAVWAQAPPATSDGRQSEILTSLEEIRQASAVVFPHDVEPKLLQANPASADVYLNAVDWHNQQIAQGILLQTLTSGEGRRVGSLSLGKVHFDVLLYVLENAKADVEAAVNTQVIQPLLAYNFDNPEAVRPRFALGSVDEKNLPQITQAYDMLLKHGVVTGKEQAVREIFDLPPLGGEGR